MRQEEGHGARRGTGGAQPVQGQEITGTIRYVDVEGGCYGIETEDGVKLDPVNLPADFEEDGLRIKARVEGLEDRVSIHMWGTLVRILEIERR